MAVLGTFLG